MVFFDLLPFLAVPDGTAQLEKSVKVNLLHLRHGSLSLLSGYFLLFSLPLSGPLSLQNWWCWGASWRLDLWLIRWSRRFKFFCLRLFVTTLWARPWRSSKVLNIPLNELSRCWLSFFFMTLTLWRRPFRHPWRSILLYCKPRGPIPERLPIYRFFIILLFDYVSWIQLIVDPLLIPQDVNLLHFLLS